MSSRHIGLFKVSKRFFADLKVDEGTNLFHRMIVLRALENFVTDEIEYVAIHPEFALIPDGSVPPEYTAKFDVTGIYPRWIPT